MHGLTHLRAHLCAQVCRWSPGTTSDPGLGRMWQLYVRTNVPTYVHVSAGSEGRQLGLLATRLPSASQEAWRRLRPPSRSRIYVQHDVNNCVAGPLSNVRAHAVGSGLAMIAQATQLEVGGGCGLLLGVGYVYVQHDVNNCVAGPLSQRV